MNKKYYIIGQMCRIYSIITIYILFIYLFIFELKIDCSNSIICSLHQVKEKINKNTTQEVT